MRAPPPVEFTSVLGRAWRAALSLLVGVSVAAPLAWSVPYVAAHWGVRQPHTVLEGLADPFVQGAIALWAVAMAIGSVWLSRHVAGGRRTLRWDGQDWVLAGEANGRPDQRGDATLMLDLGPWMLVRFAPCAAGAAAWLPLTAAADPARWAALRGALWNWRADRRDARS